MAESRRALEVLKHLVTFVEASNYATVNGTPTGPLAVGVYLDATDGSVIALLATYANGQWTIQDEKTGATTQANPFLVVKTMVTRRLATVYIIKLVYDQRSMYGQYTVYMPGARDELFKSQRAAHASKLIAGAYRRAKGTPGATLPTATATARASRYSAGNATNRALKMVWAWCNIANKTRYEVDTMSIAPTEFPELHVLVSKARGKLTVWKLRRDRVCAKNKKCEHRVVTLLSTSSKRADKALGGNLCPLLTSHLRSNPNSFISDVYVLSPMKPIIKVFQASADGANARARAMAVLKRRDVAGAALNKLYRPGGVGMQRTMADFYDKSGGAPKTPATTGQRRRLQLLAWLRRRR